MSIPGEAPERPPAPLGEVIGGYRLDAVIGVGGMGCVYSATHLRLGRRAAVKVLREALAFDPRFVSRFFAEARIVNDVRHPCIIDIFDFVETETPRRVACIMELVPGPTLRDVLMKRGAMSPLQAVNVALQLAAVLDAVHAVGVVHRDLKPANVLVPGDLAGDLAAVPSVKVLDFGIAKVRHLSDSARTAAGVVLGTPAYMAPEQVGGEEVSAAADVYALGVVLYELLAGQRLFAGQPSQVMRQKLGGQPIALALPRALPQVERFEALIGNVVVADAAARLSLSSVRVQLERLREQLDPRTGRTVLEPPADVLPSARPRVGAAATPAPSEVARSAARLLDNVTVTPPPRRAASLDDDAVDGPAYAPTALAPSPRLEAARVDAGRPAPARAVTTSLATSDVVVSRAVEDPRAAPPRAAALAEPEPTYGGFVGHTPFPDEPAARASAAPRWMLAIGAVVCAIGLAAYGLFGARTSDVVELPREPTPEAPVVAPSASVSPSVSVSPSAFASPEPRPVARPASPAPIASPASSGSPTPSASPIASPRASPLASPTPSPRRTARPKPSPTGPLAPEDMTPW